MSLTTDRPVIDASAALAFLMNEPGADVVRPLLEQGRMSAVNLSEVIARLVRLGLDPVRAHYLGCEVVPFDTDLADRAGRLWAHTAHLGLSLGDRACLALAMRDRSYALTADRAWKVLDPSIRIVLVR